MNEEDDTYDSFSSAASGSAGLDSGGYQSSNAYPLRSGVGDNDNPSFSSGAATGASTGYNGANNMDGGTNGMQGRAGRSSGMGRNRNSAHNYM